MVIDFRFVSHSRIFRAKVIVSFHAQLLIRLNFGSKISTCFLLYCAHFWFFDVFSFVFFQKYFHINDYLRPASHELNRTGVAQFSLVLYCFFSASENEYFQNGLWHLCSIDFDFPAHYRCFSFASNTHFTNCQSIVSPYFLFLMPSGISVGIFNQFV